MVIHQLAVHSALGPAFPAKPIGHCPSHRSSRICANSTRDATKKKKIKINRMQISYKVNESEHTATRRTVRSRNRLSRQWCKVCSASASSALLGSSRTRTGDGRRAARARLRSCCWPTLRLQLPDFSNSPSNPLWRKVSLRWTASRAAHSSSSATWCSGSRLSLQKLQKLII